MKELYRDVIQINQMPDNSEKEAKATSFFEKLNAMTLPSHFNWAKEIFEDIHVAETPDKTALVYYDIHSKARQAFTYLEMSQKANRLINLLSAQGVGHGDNMYMMTPICPEIWFSSLACIKAGIVAVPTATTMTARELEYRFETYKPDVILADASSCEVLENAIEETGITPRVKLVIGEREGWTSFSAIDAEADEAPAADTASDEILFCFFTSGTTGLPKRVGHTAASYPKIGRASCRERV